MPLDLSYLARARIILGIWTCLTTAVLECYYILWILVIPLVTGGIYHITMKNKVFNILHRSFNIFLVGVVMFWARLEVFWWLMALICSIGFSVSIAILLGFIFGLILSIIFMYLEIFSYLESSYYKDEPRYLMPLFRSEGMY